MNRKDRRASGRKRAKETAAALRRTHENPGDSAAVLKACHRLFELGRIAETLPTLAKSVERHPDDIHLRTAWAYALASTGDIPAAIEQYSTLVAQQPNSAPLLTNLAVLLIRAGDIEPARSMLARASELAPAHANTAYTLGELFDKLHDREQAHLHYRRAVTLFRKQIGRDPGLEKVNDLVKLAVAQEWLGESAAALAGFERAISLNPRHVLAHIRRGLALANLRRLPDAIASLRRALAADPDQVIVRRALADLLMNAGDTRAAAKQYRAARQLNPEDDLIRYLLAAAEQSDTPETAPPAYIRSLFDDYARNFEQHLVETLKYRAPELLWQSLQDIAHPSPSAWDVIDLGCGTGLCGPIVRPFARTLVGIDLSEQMLEKAKEKGVYTTLIKSDLTEALHRMPNSADAIVSTDVFIYIGNLMPVFVTARDALRTGGWFGFTAESHDGDGFHLESTGRYGHARSYLDRMAADTGFDIARYGTIVARYQSGTPVSQHLYVLRRR